MQVELDAKCMHTNFGGRELSGFGDIATFNFGQISLWTHGLQFIVVKKFNTRNSAQNFVISPMTIIIRSTFDTFINCRSEAKF